PPPGAILLRPGACPRSDTGRASRTSPPTPTSCADAGAGRASSDEPLQQEGALGGRAPDGPDRSAQRGEQQKDAAHVVARFDDLPRDGRPHGRRPRRPQARPRLHQRVDGRPQARRVRPHARLSRSRRLGQGAMSPRKPQDPSQGRPEEPDKIEAEVPEATEAAGAEKPARRGRRGSRLRKEAKTAQQPAPEAEEEAAPPAEEDGAPRAEEEAAPQAGEKAAAAVPEAKGGRAAAPAKQAEGEAAQE